MNRMISTLSHRRNAGATRTTQIRFCGATERLPYRVVAIAVDDLSTSRQLSGDSIAAVTRLAGKAGVLDLIAVVGFYTTLALILNSFGTPIDPDVAQELAEAPLQPL